MDPLDSRYWASTVMPYAERRELIMRVEQARNSRVLTYVLGDRMVFPPGIPGFATQLGTEPQLLFLDQLKAIGRCPNLDLFLYTRGGNTDSVWPLVCLLREYCDRLTVIVPFRAHSGGTLICLGAHEIIMTEYAELSPIDPTTGNAFNPTDPTNPTNRFGISVEDVAAYFELAKDRAGITKEEHKLEVLKELVSGNRVHPLALGNVQRVYLQIRRLAERLLALHLDERGDKQRIERIVTALAEKFYSHVHAITRVEAKDLLGDWVRAPTDAERQPINDLFEGYAATLGLRDTFSLPEYMGDQLTRDLTALAAFIESSARSHVYRTTMKMSQRPMLPPNVQVQIPPGQPIPLGPWVTRNFEWGIQNVGWVANDAGV